MGEGTGNQIVHQVQAGVAADESLLRLAVQHICPVFTRAVQTCQIAVVTGVLAVNHALFRIRQNGQHIADKIQLQLAGLAAGHIQIQIFMLQLLISSDHFLKFHTKLFTASARISSHFHHPFWISWGHYTRIGYKMQYYIARNFIFSPRSKCFQWNAQKSLCRGRNFIQIHALLFAVK